MSSDVLNLDEIFRPEPIRVRFQGKEYELLSPEALGPREIARFQKLQEAAEQWRNEEMSDEDAERVEGALDAMLGILCSSLPVGEMPFLYKARILSFYAAQVQKKASREME